MGESVLAPQFHEAFAARLGRGAFAYLALGLFYGLDVGVTIALVGSGHFQELNPLNRFLLDAGATTWVVFRAFAFFGITLAFAAAFALTAITVVQRPRLHRALDHLHDAIVGSVTLFYALALFHNLAVLARLGPQAA